MSDFPWFHIQKLRIIIFSRKFSIEIRKDECILLGIQHGTDIKKISSTFISLPFLFLVLVLGNITLFKHAPKNYHITLILHLYFKNPTLSQIGIFSKCSIPNLVYNRYEKRRKEDHGQPFCSKTFGTLLYPLILFNMLMDFGWTYTVACLFRFAMYSIFLPNLIFFKVQWTKLNYKLHINLHQWVYQKYYFFIINLSNRILSSHLCLVYWHDARWNISLLVDYSFYLWGAHKRWWKWHVFFITNKEPGNLVRNIYTFHN